MALTKRGKENAQLLDSNPNIQKLLPVIRGAEGADYNSLYGDRLSGTRKVFNDYRDHPGIRVSFKQNDGKTNTTSAAGGYQYQAGTWNDVKRRTGVPDFSPRSQDIGAVDLIRQRGALDDVLNGNFEAAIKKLGKEWASLPSSTAPQNKKTWTELGQKLGFTPTAVEERQDERTILAQVKSPVAGPEAAPSQDPFQFQSQLPSNSVLDILGNIANNYATSTSQLATPASLGADPWSEGLIQAAISDDANADREATVAQFFGEDPVNRVALPKEIEREINRAVRGL